VIIRSMASRRWGVRCWTGPISCWLGCITRIWHPADGSRISPPDCPRTAWIWHLPSKVPGQIGACVASFSCKRLVSLVRPHWQGSPKFHALVPELVPCPPTSSARRGMNACIIQPSFQRRPGPWPRIQPESSLSHSPGVEAASYPTVSTRRSRRAMSPGRGTARIGRAPLRRRGPKRPR
jgi:hypothetical protein